MKSSIDVPFKIIGMLTCIAVVAGLVCAGLAGCTPEVTLEVKGDREIVHVSSGNLSANSSSKAWFILRDKDTGIDYLAVVDAGIVRLDQRTVRKPEPAEKQP